MKRDHTELSPQGPEKLYLEDSAKGLPLDAAEKLRAMLAFLQDMQDPESCASFPCGRRTRLHVTRNWRLTFRIEEERIVDVDYEDYH